MDKNILRIVKALIVHLLVNEYNLSGPVLGKKFGVSRMYICSQSALGNDYIQMPYLEKLVTLVRLSLKRSNLEYFTSLKELTRSVCTDFTYGYPSTL